MRETAANGESSELHVLDQWCFLGTVRSENELHELQDSAPRPRFDLDTYKILTRFLLNGKKRSEIIPLSPTCRACAIIHSAVIITHRRKLP